MRVHPDHLELQGFAIRDSDSTTYTGAIETAEDFGNGYMGKPGGAAGAGRKRKL